MIVTDIRSDMKGKNASGLFRFPFTYSATDKAVQSMQLRVTIDDAFVAYLNGTEIGNYAKPDPLTWKSGVSTSVARGDAIVVSTPITIDVTAFAGALIGGQNVLAIQGMNTFDSQYLPLPLFNTPGGVVANNFGLTMNSSASQMIAANWRSSAAIGGSPGFSDSSSFATWAASNGGITAGSDGDSDGRDALREYAEGTSPSQADLVSMPLGRQSFDVGGVIDEYLTISIPTSLAADDVARIPQVSDSLAAWVDSPEGFLLIEETNNGDGTGRLLYRSSVPLDGLPAGTYFVRFHYQLR